MKSADVFVRFAGDIDPDVVQAVKLMILATKTHQLTLDYRKRIVSDIDMAILSAPENRFKEYEEQIRAEYSNIPDSLFYPARKKLIMEWLSKGRTVYHTDFFRSFTDTMLYNLQGLLATDKYVNAP